MSLGPDTIPAVFDLLDGLGTSTGTRAGLALGLPPGRKAVQISVVTSATQTIQIQNSLNKTNWFWVVENDIASNDTETSHQCRRLAKIAG